MADFLEGVQVVPVPWEYTPNADYHYRLVCHREIFLPLMLSMVKDIDYPNFKNAVHGNPIRDHAYMDCWAAMHAAQSKMGHADASSGVGPT